MKKNRLISASIGLAVVLLSVHKVKNFLRAWKRGISKSRKHIEWGNKPASRFDAVKKGLGL